VPTFSLDPGSVVVALTVGVSCWLVFHLLWMAGRGLRNLVAAQLAPRPPRLP
jgi:hypothetical protein